MGVSLVDTHAHLSGIEFVNDLDEVIANARALGVHRIVTVGTDLESSRKSIEIAERYEAVYAAVGIHPCYVTEAKDGDWDEIAQLIDHPKVVALGETGLDLYWDKTTLDLQRVFFRKHLELSRLSELPFIVHCRGIGGGEFWRICENHFQRDFFRGLCILIVGVLKVRKKRWKWEWMFRFQGW